MGFIKKNLLLILCMAVVLAAVGLFIPGKMLASRNKGELQGIQSKCDQVDSLSKKVSELNQAILEQYQAKAKEAKEDEAKILSFIQETTNRPLIFEDVFPEPKGLSIIVQYQRFAELYCQKVDDYLKAMNAADRPSVLEEENIRAEYRKKVATTSSSGGAGRGVSPGDGRGMEVGREGGERRGGEGVSGGEGGGRSFGGSSDPQEQKLMEDFRQQRADSIQCYASSYAFCCYSHWRNFQRGERDILLTESWYTQIADWIQQDVVGAIRQINEKSSKVSESPVKRLIEVSFGGQMATGEASGGGFGQTSVSPMGSEGAAARKRSEIALPCYVINRDQSSGGTGSPGGMGEGPPPGMSPMPGGESADSSSSGVSATNFEGQLVFPITRHCGNEEIDVVQFEVAVVIDNTQIQNFINALQSERYTEITKADGTMEKIHRRNQVTVLTINISPIQMEMEKQAGYHYGSACLNELRLTCEYVFFKAGYEKNKPELVKKFIVSSPASSGAGAMGGGMGGGMDGGMGGERRH